MATVTHLDTHVVVWLYANAISEIPPRVKRRLESDALTCSPIVTLEIDFLREIGRVNVSGRTMVDDLARRIALSVLATPLSAVVAAASPLSWTRDPFDRVIVASAAADGSPLLTRDKVIRKHYAHASW